MESGLIMVGQHLLLPQQKLPRSHLAFPAQPNRTRQGDPAAAPQDIQQSIYTVSYYSAYFSQIQIPQISHLSSSARNTGVDYITIRFHKGYQCMTKYNLNPAVLILLLLTKCSVGTCF